MSNPDWSPGSYQRASQVSDDWDSERLLNNVLVAISAATAHHCDWLDTPLLMEGLPYPATTEQELDYIYRIGGVYSFGTAILELHCEETGQSPFEVLKKLSLRANQCKIQLEQQSSFKEPQDPPEDTPPGLEPV